MLYAGLEKKENGWIFALPADDFETFFTWNTAIIAVIPLIMVTMPMNSGMIPYEMSGKTWMRIPKMTLIIPKTLVPPTLVLNAWNMWVTPINTPETR